MHFLIAKNTPALSTRNPACFSFLDLKESTILQKSLSREKNLISSLFFEISRNNEACYNHVNMGK